MERNKRRHALVGTTEQEIFFGFCDVFKTESINSSNVLRSPHKVIAYPRVKCPNYPKCHEFSIKIFLHELSDDVIEEACNTVLEEHPEISYIDNVIVSVERGVTLTELDLVFRQLEVLRDRGLIGFIGLSDLTVLQLNHIARFAKLDILQISPFNYDQLHEAEGSTVAKIIAIGQRHGVRITSHGDPVSSPHALKIDLNGLLVNSEKKWHSQFIARYTQRSTDRNIITMKGYCMGINTD